MGMKHWWCMHGLLLQSMPEPIQDSIRHCPYGLHKLQRHSLPGSLASPVRKAHAVLRPEMLW